VTLAGDQTGLADALALSEQRFRALVQNAHEVVAVVDESANLVYASPALERVTGYPISHFFGQSSFAFVHHDDLAGVAIALAHLIDHPDEQVTTECRGPHADGTWRWFELRATNMLDDPAVRGLVVNFRDVTERRHWQQALQASEAAYRSMIELSQSGIALSDGASVAVFANQQMADLLGYDDAAEMIGRPIAEFRSPRSPLSFAATQDRRRHGVAETFDDVLLRKDGTDVWVSIAATPRPGDGPGYHGSLVMVTDITDRKRAADELARRLDQQAQVAHLGQRALIGTDLQRLMDEAAAAVLTTLGVDGASFLTLDGDELVQRSAAGLATRLGDNFRFPITGTDAIAALLGGGALVSDDLANDDRFEIPSAFLPLAAAGVACVTLDGRNGPVGLAGVFTASPRSFDSHDVNFLQNVANVVSAAIERSRTEDEIRQRALHDDLTGLPNRGLFTDRLGQALRRRQRTGSDVAVLFLDLDRFKLVNDSLGHEAGDDVLVEVSNRLREAVREGDTVARLSGDEFTILCDELNGIEDAVTVAQRVMDSLAAPMTSHGVFVRASIGMAMADDEHETPGALLRDADVALYRAKDRGRNRFEIFDAASREEVIQRVELERALRDALGVGALRLAYQPKVDVATGRVIGAEALVRWEHPERGPIPPLEFVSLAEETGLIGALGSWVLREACHQAAVWETMPVAVNLSAHQLADPELPSVVRGIILETGIAPSLLTLEITESIQMEDADSTAATVLALKELGVRLAIDDFGTGYSSLAYLRRFAVDELKVDRSFIAGLGTDSEDTAIVSAVINLAKTLGLVALAEGVETAGQLETLADLGCQLAQGFYWCPAIDPVRFEARFVPRRLAIRVTANV
jgi:diguanylate cyclase (GGDEF)-like protein/PAS domain S-box-containing protein